MKRSALWLLAIVFLISGVCTAQKFSTEAWQEDLRYLQKTVHEDYPFLFKKITPEAFDASVDSLYAAIPGLEEHQILVGFARLVASFGYGHTVLGYWEGKIPLHELPIVLYHYEDGIYLQGVHRKYEALVGSRLLAIENTPIQEVLQLMLPVVPAENEMFVKAYGIHYLTYPEFLHAQGVIPQMRTEIELTLEKEGRVFRERIQAVPSERFPRQYGMVVPGEDWVESRDTGNTPLYLKDLDKIYYFEYLPEHKTVYVRQSQIQDEETEPIPVFYERVFEFIEGNDVEKLILDVRLNGGGNNYKNKPVVTGIIQSEKINKQGKLMVIIGRRTFSACQNLVNELDNYTNAVFVGEPTAENINFYGDNRPVTLPNTEINAFLSFAWWQDKPQWENGPWTTPHLATGMTFEQYRTNQDPALEAALAFNDSTFILNPMDYLTELFTSGQVEKVKPEAARMIGDPNYAFFDFKAAFDKTGDNLLKSNRLQESYFVYSMTAEFYPESARIWNQLGQVHWKMGEGEKARNAAKKALELAGQGEEGQIAMELLERIEKGG